MKNIIITGANSGIGYETAKHLALAGNTVIAASRKKESILQVIDELNRLCSGRGSKGKVLFFDLDLASLKSDNPKIINVCSASAEKGAIASIRELADISRVEESNYDAMTSYRESKLAQQVSVMHMSRQESYRKIKFSLIHPGIVNTNLFYRNSGAWYRIVMVPFVYLGYLFGFFQTPAKGAQTSIWLAENDDYETGRYWHHRKQLTPNPISQELKYPEELWNWTVEQPDKIKSTSHVA